MAMGSILTETRLYHSLYVGSLRTLLRLHLIGVQRVGVDIPETPHHFLRGSRFLRTHSVGVVHGRGGRNHISTRQNGGYMVSDEH